VLEVPATPLAALGVTPEAEAGAAPIGGKRASTRVASKRPTTAAAAERPTTAAEPAEAETTAEQVEAVTAEPESPGALESDASGEAETPSGDDA
jgi:hypothetical protein